MTETRSKLRPLRLLALVLIVIVATGAGGGSGAEATEPILPSSNGDAADSSSEGDAAAKSEFRDARNQFTKARDRFLQEVPEEPSSASGQLPLTGLAVVPVAIAGLLMLLVGAVGRRRYSR